MTIYYDIAAAVHRHPGLGRYADSLVRALLAEHADALTLFYYGDAAAKPPAGLEHVPRRTVVSGRKRWRLQVWLSQLLHLSFDRLLPQAKLYHATEHLLMPLQGVPTMLRVASRGAHEGSGSGGMRIVRAVAGCGRTERQEVPVTATCGGLR